MRTAHSKYKNLKTEIGKNVFDSKKEAQRFMELELLVKTGTISNLQRQVKFVLIPSQKIDGKVAERACSYVADFVYSDKQGNTIVEDTKGVKTKDYIIKRKLMLWVHGIKIKEV